MFHGLFSLSASLVETYKGQRHFFQDIPKDPFGRQSGGSKKTGQRKYKSHCGQLADPAKSMSADLILNVYDSGKEIEEKQISSPTSVGLIGIRDRVPDFGGKISITGSLGKGTKVLVQLPSGKIGKR